MVGDSYIFQYFSIFRKVTEVKVNKATMATLTSHFNRIYPGKEKQVNLACKANVGTDWRPQQNLSGRSDSDGGSTSKLEAAADIHHRNLMAQGSSVLHSTFDKTILRFLVDNLMPPQIVDCPTFRDMVHTLNPIKEVPSRRTLRKRILETYGE